LNNKQEQDTLQRHLKGLTEANRNKLNRAIHHQNNREKKIADSYVEDKSGLYDLISYPVVLAAKKNSTETQGEFAASSPKAKAESTADANLQLPISRGLFGTVLGNVTDPSSEFVTIELEIRGDPYWLGAGNMEENKLINKNNGSVDKSQLATNTAFYQSGDEMILLSFNTGQRYDETTGIMSLSNGNSSSFNGLYRVITVKHSFKGGQFTQSLTAGKDVFSQAVDQKLVSEQRIKSYLNVTDNSGQPSVEGSSSTSDSHYDKSLSNLGKFAASPGTGSIRGPF
jgi:hypothetical protein